MKKVITLASILCLGIASLSPAFAEDDSNNDVIAPSAVSDSDPCKVTFCMFGYLKGEKDSECSGSIKHYFSIVKKKKGKFNPANTAKERLKEMNKCPTADKGKVGDINDKFGRLRG